MTAELNATMLRHARARGEPPVPGCLSAIARSHEQRRTLMHLLKGESVYAYPYWRGARLQRPRASALQAWRHFCSRLTDAGYAVHCVQDGDPHPSCRRYTLRSIEEVAP